MITILYNFNKTLTNLILTLKYSVLTHNTD